MSSKHTQILPQEVLKACNALGEVPKHVRLSNFLKYYIKGDNLLGLHSKQLLPFLLEYVQGNNDSPYSIKPSLRENYRPHTRSLSSPKMYNVKFTKITKTLEMQRYIRQAGVGLSVCLCTLTASKRWEALHLEEGTSLKKRVLEVLELVEEMEEEEEEEEESNGTVPLPPPPPPSPWTALRPYDKASATQCR